MGAAENPSRLCGCSGVIGVEVVRGDGWRERKNATSTWNSAFDIYQTLASGSAEASIPFLIRKSNGACNWERYHAVARFKPNSKIIYLKNQ